MSDKKYVGLYVDDEDFDDDDNVVVLTKPILPSYVLSVVDEGKF